MENRDVLLLTFPSLCVYLFISDGTRSKKYILTWFKFWKVQFIISLFIIVFLISYVLYISSLIAWNEGIAIKSHNLYSMIKYIKG